MLHYNDSIWYFGIGLGVRRIDDGLVIILPFVILNFDIDDTERI